MPNKCAGCGQNRKLKPFWTFTDPDRWWLNRGNLSQLCGNCHTARTALRRQDPDKLPYWWFIAERLSRYIPPEPPAPIPKPLKLQQASLSL